MYYLWYTVVPVHYPTPWPSPTDPTSHLAPWLTLFHHWLFCDGCTPACWLGSQELIPVNRLQTIIYNIHAPEMNLCVDSIRTLSCKREKVPTDEPLSEKITES